MCIILLSICGCTTLTIVDDWGKVPSNSTIEVHTKDGKIYEFDNWKINKDSSIVGATQVSNNKWISVTLQATSIATLYVQDSRAAKAMETSVTVAGSLAIAAAAVGCIYIIIHVPFNLGGH